MTLKGISAEYNRTYEEADKIFKKYNPCQFKEGSCIRARSARMAINRDYQITVEKNGCCYPCRYLGPKGCKVKSLGCKLFLCVYIEDLHKGCYKEINQLRERSYKVLGYLHPCMAKTTFLYNYGHIISKGL